MVGEDHTRATVRRPRERERAPIASLGHIPGLIAIAAALSYPRVSFAAPELRGGTTVRGPFDTDIVNSQTQTPADVRSQAHARDPQPDHEFDHDHAAPTHRDETLADTLFAEARERIAQGQFAEAALRLEASLALAEGLGARFQLAHCNERLGKLATAWRQFTLVAERAAADGQSARERIAKSRADAIKPRLATVTVHIAEAESQTEGLVIAIDGARLPRSQWNTGIDVDPGPHEVTTAVDGLAQWAIEWVARERVAEHAWVPPLHALRTYPTDASLSGESMPRASHATTANQPTAPRTDASEPVVERTSSAFTIGAVALGVGVGAVAATLGFGLLSRDHRDESRAHCMQNTCDLRGVRLRDDARTFGDVATISAIGAAGFIVAGAALLLAFPARTESLAALRHPERPSSKRTSIYFAVSNSGLGFEGTFR